MRNYMPKVGSLGLDMMFRTCTVQVSNLCPLIELIAYSI
jgi:gamma-glutamylcysteine synthetase